MKTVPISSLLILAAAWTGIVTGCRPAPPQVKAEYLLEIRPPAGEAVTPEMRTLTIQDLEDVLAPLQFTRVRLEPAPQAAQIKLTVQYPEDFGATQADVHTLIAQALNVQTLALALVHPSSSSHLVSEVQAGKIIPGSVVKEPYDATTGRAEVVELTNQLKGNIVANAYVTFESLGYQINVVLNGDATAKMRALSGENIGRQLAIILNDKVVSAPTIQSELGDRFVTTGQFEQAEAEKLATFLKNPLANPVVIVNTSPPGSSLAAP